MKVSAPQFDPSVHPRSGKYRFDLTVAERISLPVLLARGATPGRTLVVIANIHGDEYEGVRAIFELFDLLDVAELSGDLIAVPSANPPAFWNKTRTSPIDEKNLARIFPGAQDGSASERIAFTLAHSILSKADFFIDLHSGGIAYRMPSMVGYSRKDQRSYEAALAFGSPVIWGHDEIAAGRTISYAQAIGVPWLYTEARGAGRIHPEDLAMMKQGVRNVMQHLGMLPGKVQSRPMQYRLVGNGNTDDGIAASSAGFFMTAVNFLEEVEKGSLLGTLVNLRGELIEEYYAPISGVVAMIRELPVVAAGDSLYLIAHHEER